MIVNPLLAEWCLSLPNTNKHTDILLLFYRQNLFVRLLSDSNNRYEDNDITVDYVKRRVIIEKGKIWIATFDVIDMKKKPEYHFY